MADLWKYAVVLVVLLLSGCTDPIETYAPNDTTVAQHVKSYAEKQKGVEKAHIYIVDDYFVVALNISPWRRYGKQKVEDKLTKYLEQHYPNHEIVVSADRKLFFELSKMSFEKQDDVKKKLKELQELLKEQT